MRSLRIWIGVLLTTLFVATAIFAQDTGSITGTVRDSSGAVIPGAEVVVSNAAAGLNRSTTSNAEGDYLAAGLPAGSYDLSVTAKGFKKYDATGIVLRIAEKARVDVSMQIGEATTTVTVEGAGVAQVETQSSDLAGTVTGKEISQLVLNGRNFTQLVTLAPGVSNQTGQDEGTVGVYGSVLMSMNGGRTEYNNWEIDGGDNMDNGSNGTLNVYPNVDAIAEVKVLTSNYGAQYGRNGSGTVETVTKSGTKDFHGDAFEFVRNDVFNARNFFQGDRPSYKKNDFGYTIGGPVFIPGHYNTNKDRTFFFWSQEWRKERVPGQTFYQQVPSTAERGGNFSDVCPNVVTGSNADCPIDPTTGNPFLGNQVTVDPNAQAIMALIPVGNSGSGTQSFFDAAPVQATNWREELVRVDHNLNTNMRTYFRYIHDSWSTVTPTALWSNGTSNFPTIGTNFVGPGVSLVAHLTANTSPTLLNEFIFSYTTDHIFLNALGPAARPSSMTMTPLVPNSNFGGLLPAIQISGGAAYNGGFGEDPGYFPWNNANPTYTFRDQLSKITGNHNLQFGAYYVAAQKNEMNSPELQGLLTFDNTSAVTTGNAWADFLTGRIASYYQTSAKVKYYNRWKTFEPYFQDDWRITPHLTLNLGVRVSLLGTYRDRYKTSYNFDPRLWSATVAPKIDVDGSVTGQAGALIPGSGNFFNGIVQCGVGGVPVGCMTGHLFNPAPRLGFAWDPNGDGKMAIRGGYGVFFEHTNGNEGNSESLEGSAPLVQQPQQFNIVGYANIGGGGLLFPLGLKVIPTRALWPYVQQWHLDVQREVMKNTVATVSYVGSKGTHLTLQRDVNQLLAGQSPFTFGQPLTTAECASGVVNGQTLSGVTLNNLNVACGASPDPLRPYTGFSDITSLEDGANSIYHALQISVRRHVGHFNFDLAYTYSHSIDDSSDRGDNSFVNSYNLARTRASSNFDQRHLLNIGYVYDIPFFQNPGLGHTLLGGWQLSGITTFQTGTPFNVTNAGVTGLGAAGDGIAPGDNAGVGNGTGTGSFTDIIGNKNSAPPVTNVTGVTGPLLYNPGAFAAPTGLTFGNSGRNILFNPARTNFDMGLFKSFAIREHTSIDFRAEAFNIFNHTQWSGINNSASCYAGPNNSAGDPSCVGSSSFLHPSGAHNPRIMQFGFKFIF